MRSRFDAARSRTVVLSLWASDVYDVVSVLRSVVGRPSLLLVRQMNVRELAHASLLAEAALRVVVNAYGTKPRHTAGRDGGCRNDCIPCGLVALAECFPDNGIAVRVAKDLRP